MGKNKSGFDENLFQPMVSQCESIDNRQLFVKKDKQKYFVDFAENIESFINFW